MDPKASAFKKAAAFEARFLKPIPKPLAVEVHIFVYRPRRIGDLDNVSKVVLDSLNGLAWEDDSQIDRLSLRRFDAKQNPHVFLRWRT